MQCSRQTDVLDIVWWQAGVLLRSETHLVQPDKATCCCENSNDTSQVGPSEFSDSLTMLMDKCLIEPRTQVCYCLD
jgi:hypothetical protein